MVAFQNVPGAGLIAMPDQSLRMISYENPILSETMMGVETPIPPFVMDAADSKNLMVLLE